MQITSQFTIAIHIITAVDYFKDTDKVTSKFLAGSVGANPVTVRNVVGKLKKAGILDISQGKSGIALARRLDDISFYDVYQALDCIQKDGLFHFHKNPNANCPVGRNIHKSVDGRLKLVQHAMEDEMKSITLADVVKDTRAFIAAEQSPSR